jgi:hypothetical protein
VLKGAEFGLQMVGMNQGSSESREATRFVVADLDLMNPCWKELNLDFKWWE